jgi:hypothetical protein
MESGLSTVPVECSCTARCPDAPICGCVDIIGPPRECRCKCNSTTPLPPVILKASDRINLNARNIELGELAEFIHAVTTTETDILIPVSDLRKPVTMTLKDVTFADAIEQLGLSLHPSKDSGY